MGRGSACSATSDSERCRASTLPMYKPSTQKNHRHILAKHLLPRFGDGQLTELGRQDVQAYVASLSQDG